MKSDISGQTRLAGVIANPIKHSLSPMIHNKAYEVKKIDAVYLAFEVEKEKFNQALSSLLTLDMLGVNISMPYKRTAFDACDKVSKEAELMGVVNTIIPENGKLMGYNTDGIGFVESLKSQQVSVIDKRMTILGAGGAAKAVICQCALEKAKEINVFKRKNATYQEVAMELAEIAKKTGTLIRLFDYKDDKTMNELIKTSDIIINGTQIGMGEDKSLPVANMCEVNSNHVLVDLIYHPLETEFLKQGKQRGALTINGLGMLVHQAAHAFKLMTKTEMPVIEIEEMLTEQWR